MRTIWRWSFAVWVMLGVLLLVVGTAIALAALAMMNMVGRKPTAKKDKVRGRFQGMVDRMPIRVVVVAKK